MNQIDDMRNIKEFKGVSFSKFKKSDVQKQYIKSMLNSNIEPACFWGCELICAGHYKDLWDAIIFVFVKHIQIANPKMAVYIDRRLTSFIGILNDTENVLQLRNNEKIRKMFAEITSILSLSKKSHPYEEIKIKRAELTELCKLKAPDITFATTFKKDPKQLFIPYNELMYALNVKNALDACYWITWIIEYDLFCKNLIAEQRAFINICSTNVIWMIWDALLEYSKTEGIVKTIVQSLLNIFEKKYTRAENKRKLCIFYFAVSLLTGTMQYVNICDNMDLVDSVTENIDAIYKQIKMNEVPEQNFDKTLEKIDAMNSFIPRI